MDFSNSQNTSTQNEKPLDENFDPSSRQDSNLSEAHDNSPLLSSQREDNSIRTDRKLLEADIVSEQQADLQRIPEEESKIPKNNAENTISSSTLSIEGRPLIHDPQARHQGTQNLGNRKVAPLTPGTSTDTAGPNQRFYTLHQFMSEYEQMEVQFSDEKTTTQILDEIAQRQFSYGNLGEKSVKEDKQNIDIDLSEKFPHTLANNDFIYYDKNESCFKARNLQQNHSRQIDLYQLHGKKQLDAKLVRFISNYGKWVIITSWYENYDQFVDKTKSNIALYLLQQPLKKAVNWMNIVQYYNKDTYCCQYEFKTSEQVIQQECTDYALVQILSTSEPGQYRINVYGDKDNVIFHLKSTLLTTEIYSDGNLNMILSSNMDIAIQEIQKSKNSYIFNIANEGNDVNLMDCKSFKQRANRPGHQGFNASLYARPGLTEAAIEEIKEVFDLIDADGSGRIDPKELKRALQDLAYKDKSSKTYEMISDLDVEGNYNIDFHKFLNMIPASDDLYAYKTGQQLLAIVANYLLTGRPFGKSYEMCVWDTISHQNIFEHTFDLHLQCTRVSKNNQQIIFLLSDLMMQESQICVMNLVQMNIQQLFNCSNYYDNVFLAENWFFLTQNYYAAGSPDQSDGNGQQLKVDFDDIAGGLFYQVIKMLASLDSVQAHENVTYKPDLQYWVIYPQMINITHAYSYYGAHGALKEWMDENVQLMLSTDNESALSLCVKHADTENGILNDILKHMLENVKLKETEVDFKDQCRIQSQLRSIQYWITELNQSNILYLPQLYEAIFLDVQAENIHLNTPRSQILPSPYPDSAVFDDGEANKSFEKYAVQNYLRSKLQKQSYDKEEVKYSVSAILLNFSIGSESCMQFIQSLVTLRNQYVLQIDIIKQYAETCWRKAFYIHFILFLMYCFQTVAMSVHVIVVKDTIANQLHINTILLFIVFALSFFTTVYVVLQAFKQNLQLVIDILNLKSSAILFMADIFTTVFTAIYIVDYVVLNNRKIAPSDLQVVITLQWLRLLLNTRVFKKTRHMIMILAATIRQGMPFAAIILMAVVTGSFSSMAEESSYQFSKYFLMRFLFLFGEFPDNIDEMSIVSTLGYTFGTCLIAMNLYIAIVSDVFDQFQSNKELIETQTILWMTLSAGNVAWFWNRTDNLQYFHHCTSALLNKQQDLTWEGKVKQLENFITKSHKESSEKLNHFVKDQNKRLDVIAEDQNKKFEHMEEKQNEDTRSLKEDIVSLNQKIDNMLKLLESRVNT